MSSTTTCSSCGATLEPTMMSCRTCGAARLPAPHPSGLSGELRGWGIAAHLSGLGIGLTSGGILGFVGPLFVWLLKRDEHGFVEHHGKEALNFQLTALVAVAAAVALTIPAIIVGVLTLGIGLVVMAGIVAAAAAAWFVLPILGAVKASNGEGYRYPVSIRFVR